MASDHTSAGCIHVSRVGAPTHISRQTPAGRQPPKSGLEMEHSFPAKSNKRIIRLQSKHFGLHLGPWPKNSVCFWQKFSLTPSLWLTQAAASDRSPGCRYLVHRWTCASRSCTARCKMHRTAQSILSAEVVQMANRSSCYAKVSNTPRAAAHKKEENLHDTSESGKDKECSPSKCTGLRLSKTWLHPWHLSSGPFQLQGIQIPPTPRLTKDCRGRAGRLSLKPRRLSSSVGRFPNRPSRAVDGGSLVWSRYSRFFQQVSRGTKRKTRCVCCCVDGTKVLGGAQGNTEGQKRRFWEERQSITHTRTHTHTHLWFVEGRQNATLKSPPTSRHRETTSWLRLGERSARRNLFRFFCVFLFLLEAPAVAPHNPPDRMIRHLILLRPFSHSRQLHHCLLT